MAEREILTGDGRRLVLKTYFDTGDPDLAALTAQVVEGRLREYQRHNLLGPDAPPDGMRGSHVEILVAVDPETSEPVASLRKIHTTGKALDVLPSYHRFDEDVVWSGSGRQTLHGRAANNRPVVEVASLWKKDGLETGIKIELIKSAIQRSYQYGELWFMAVVRAEYDRLQRDFGARVVRALGNLVRFRDDGVASDVRGLPAMVDPLTFYDDLVDDILDARRAPTPDLRKAAMRGMLLHDCLIGLDPALLAERTRRRIEEVINGPRAR